MNVKNVIIGIVCAVILVSGVVFLIPNDRQRIKKQFSRMSEYMAKEGEESVLIMASKGASVMSLLTEHCEIQSADMRLLGMNEEVCSKREVVKIMIMVREQFSVMSLCFQNIDIDLVEENKANVTLCAKLLGKAVTGEAVHEIRELNCVLLKQDRKWLFSKCKVLEIVHEK